MRRPLGVTALSRRGYMAFAPAVVFGALAGCAGVLGIPSDLERESTDAAGEATSDALIGDEHAVPDGGGGDGANGGDAMEADAFQPPECDPLKEFGTPELVMSVSSTEAEGSPKLTDDELTIYFDALRTGTQPYWDIYTATRAKKTDDFGTPVLVAGGVNTPNNHEFAPNVSALATRIFFERKDPTTFVDNFWSATRANVTLPWEPATLIPGVNFPAYQTKLEVRGDGNELYFSAKGAGTKLHLYVAKLTAGNYVTTQLTELGSGVTSEEFGSAVSKDGLTIFFSSTRSPTLGGEDVWVAHRASTNDPFGPPAQVAPVNSTLDEEPTWLSNDGCRLYLSSNRPGSIGAQNIYLATKPK